LKEIDTMNSKLSYAFVVFVCLASSAFSENKDNTSVDSSRADIERPFLLDSMKTDSSFYAFVKKPGFASCLRFHADSTQEIDIKKLQNDYKYAFYLATQQVITDGDTVQGKRFITECALLDTISEKRDNDRIITFKGLRFDYIKGDEITEGIYKFVLFGYHSDSPIYFVQFFDHEQVRETLFKPTNEIVYSSNYIFSQNTWPRFGFPLRAFRVSELETTLWKWDHNSYCSSTYESRLSKIKIARAKHRRWKARPWIFNSPIILHSTLVYSTYFGNKNNKYEKPPSKYLLGIPAALISASLYEAIKMKDAPPRVVDYLYSVLFYTEVAILLFDIWDKEIDGFGLLEERDRINLPPLPPSELSAQRIMPLKLSISF
jgi:hypothetical protein